MKALLFWGITAVAVSTANADWYEDFDSYQPGGLHGNGGWEGWGGSSACDAAVVDTVFLSPPNSVAVLPTTDIVRQFEIDSGVWQVNASVFIPSEGGGDQFFIIHNSYSPGGGYVCAHDIIFHQDTGTVEFAQTGHSVPMVTDEWIELEVIADLDGNTQEAFYNGSSLGTAAWIPSGTPAIASIDLFSFNSTTIFFDDLSIVQGAGEFTAVTWAAVKASSGWR